MCENCEPDWPSNAEVRLQLSETIHELSVNATSDRSYMSPEGFEAAIREVRAAAWDEGCAWGWPGNPMSPLHEHTKFNPYRDKPSTQVVVS